LLEDVIKKYVNDRKTRIEKRYHERKRGKRAKTVSNLIPLVSLQGLRDQQEEAIAEDRKKMLKQGIRTQRSDLIKEMERLKAEWRADKVHIVNGFSKSLQFKQWLEYTGKKNDYLSMDTQRSAMTDALKEETNGYMINTQLPDEVRESIRKAQFAPKPLNAVDFTALLHSDDIVDFRLTREDPHEEIDKEEETLPVINVAAHEEVVITSSPPKSPSLPLLPDYDSPPPSTPCPYKHQTQLRDSLRELIREGRAFAAGSLTGQDNTDTAQFVGTSVSRATALCKPPQSLPPP
jgi:hypothetical protein